jgi:hypothetical protein
VLSARVSRSTRSHAAAAAQRQAATVLTMTQWDQLIARIGGIPTPKIAAKPTSAAILDTKHH